MAYIQIPRDISKIKNKVALNLTKRQLICFGLGVLIGLPIFFVLYKNSSPSVATVSAMLIIVPCFLFGIYEKDGQPLEKVFKNMVSVMFLRPKERPYSVRNFYDYLYKRDKFEKEVKKIVKKEIKAQQKKSKTNR